MKLLKHPLTGSLRSPPLPLPGEEETPTVNAAFLSPHEVGESWPRSGR